MKKPIYINEHEFSRAFPDDSRCERFLHAIRAVENFKCINKECKLPLFDYVPHYKRKYLRCRGCQQKVFPAAGTIFESNRRGLKKCFDILFQVLSTPSGVSIAQLKKRVGGDKDALRVFVEKIQTHCGIVTDFYFDNPDYPVQVDESYVKTGPKGLGRDFPFATGRGSENNTPYEVYTEHITGKTKIERIRGVDSDTLDALIQNRVSKNVKIYSDSFKGYNNLNNIGYKYHGKVNHKRQWVFKGVQTQAAENVNSQVKRAYRNHNSISDDKLQGFADLISFQRSFRLERDWGFIVFLKSLPPYYRPS